MPVLSFWSVIQRDSLAPFQPCECDTSGSVQPVCNYTDGQCECQPGVGERTCTACEQDHYGLSNDAFAGKLQDARYACHVLPLACSLSELILILLYSPF